MKLIHRHADLERSKVYCKVKNQGAALAGVAQWIEHRPANKRVASSIPIPGTCLDRCVEGQG